MTMTRNKLMAWVIAFLMAFTVFGVLGVSQVNAAEGDAGLTVKLVATDKTETPVVTYTADQLKAKAGNDFYPYLWSGKSGVTVAAAKGVKVEDLINGVEGIDMNKVCGLKVGSGDFLPNNNQLDYLDRGVTFVNAKLTEEGKVDTTDETSLDVPFMISTEMYYNGDNGIQMAGETDTVQKVFDAIVSKINDGSAVAGKNRSVMGSMGTSDLAGNKFVSDPDAIYLYQGNDQDLTVKGVKKTVKVKKAKAVVKAPVKVTGQQEGADITYTKVKVNKKKGNFSVDSATGDITVKKGTPKGKYTVTVKVAVSGVFDPDNNVLLNPAKKNAQVIIIVK